MSPRNIALTLATWITLPGLMFSSCVAYAQQANMNPDIQTNRPAQTLDRMVVTATPTQTPSFNMPASIDWLDGGRMREGRLQVNLSESLAAVPGIMAQNRQNYAQDLQISVRGFGARSTFGVRGVRFYVDGIPATMPDGQGQVSNIDLASVGHMEVLRGPFSALYGNSSGGVVQVFTEDIPEAGTTQFTPSFAAGSEGVSRMGLKLKGASESAGYLFSTSHFETDGYRNHSAAKRDLANAKVSIKVDPNSQVTLIGNYVNLPKADDPLGLTRSQFNGDPRSVDASALQFNTRKNLTQTQGGAIYERKLDDVNSLRGMIYAGSRSTQQYQSIPVATQLAATSPGGVIDLKRNYAGSDLRWVHEVSFGEQHISLSAGLNFDALDEDRIGYQNFSGSGANQQLGVQGALRRDEDNRVHDFDQYLQLAWKFDPQWSTNFGLRHSHIQFDSQDHYITAGNPNDSGHIQYSATLPVFGLMFAANEQLHAYVTAGRGFETPTLNELAYSPSGKTGLNLTLQPARSNNVEVGFKARLASDLRINTAMFETRTKNEIVTLSNQGGRSTFINAGETRRRGLEFSLEQNWSHNWRSSMAYTWLDATYSTPFRTCTATPCATPTTLIVSGSRIPGVARKVLYGELAWEPPLGWRSALELRAASRIAVNDLNSDAASGYATTNVSLGYVTALAGWNINTYGRVDNIFDRKYAGSVIVNEGNGRYFEPAQGRNFLIGASAAYAF